MRTQCQKNSNIFNTCITNTCLPWQTVSVLSLGYEKLLSLFWGLELQPMHTHHLDGFLPLKKVKEGCFSLEGLPLQWPGQPDSTVAVTIAVSLGFQPCKGGILKSQKLRS